LVSVSKQFNYYGDNIPQGLNTIVLFTGYSKASDVLNNLTKTYRLGKDSFRREVWDQVLKDAVTSNSDIVFVSGRSDKTREATTEWLNWFIGYGDFKLIMRQSWDRRDDTVVKREMYDKYLSRMRVVRVYDDRPRVIRMWRDLGLDVVDVGTGEEF
jgi:hypothetical protein